jgi:hypothetical protein
MRSRTLRCSRALTALVALGRCQVGRRIEALEEVFAMRNTCGVC